MSFKSDTHNFDIDRQLSDWRDHALVFEREIGRSVIGQDAAIRKITLAIFARGHVMLEGDVGVGKTTLLRAVARGIGGEYERIEGTIDLLPSDLIYHTYLNEQGRPHIDPGPILKQGEDLSVFFFNELNRARPQVHSLLLRIMAERSVAAFNREFFFPYLQIFADRNRVEKEETFEIPSAARDRFHMEIHIERPSDDNLKRELIFNPRYHDVDRLINEVSTGILNYREIPDIARIIQTHVQASETLQNYALMLWEATWNPAALGVRLDGIDMGQLIVAGASPRGMSMMLRVARVNAWLEGRDYLIPEDIQAVFFETTAHRVFLTPVYEFRRDLLLPQLMAAIIRTVHAP